MVFSQKEAEQHMPFLSMRGGVCIQVEDFDSGHIWNLRYRYGLAFKSYISFSSLDFTTRNWWAELEVSWSLSFNHLVVPCRCTCVGFPFDIFPCSVRVRSFPIPPRLLDPSIILFFMRISLD